MQTETDKTERWTDMTKQIVAFRKYGNAPKTKKGMYRLVSTYIKQNKQQDPRDSAFRTHNSSISESHLYIKRFKLNVNLCKDCEMYLFTSFKICGTPLFYILFTVLYELPEDGHTLGPKHVAVQSR
jgi:hypothetical protein